MGGVPEPALNMIPQERMQERGQEDITAADALREEAALGDLRPTLSAKRARLVAVSRRARGRSRNNAATARREKTGRLMYVAPG